MTRRQRIARAINRWLIRLFGVAVVRVPLNNYIEAWELGRRLERDLQAGRLDQITRGLHRSTPASAPGTGGHVVRLRPSAGDAS